MRGWFVGVLPPFGTEPVVRVYSEAGSAEELVKLSAAAKQWIFD